MEPDLNRLDENERLTVEVILSRFLEVRPVTTELELFTTYTYVDIEGYLGLPSENKAGGAELVWRVLLFIGFLWDGKYDKLYSLPYSGADVLRLAYKIKGETYPPPRRRP